MTGSDEVVVAEQQQVVTGYTAHYLSAGSCERMARFSRLQTAEVALEGLHFPASQAALDQLINLSSLTVRGTSDSPTSRDLHTLVPTFASITGLRCLHLDVPINARLTGLAALSGLTHLELNLWGLRSSSVQQQEAVVEQLGAMPQLKVLRVQGELLLWGRPWLGGLQQLRVLLLTALLPSTPKPEPSVLERVAGMLEGCSPQQLPPRLLLLGLTGVPVQHTDAAGLRRRLQQVLGSRGCEVVTGPDLELVWDPTQRLAGLPEALQQALLA